MKRAWVLVVALLVGCAGNPPVAVEPDAAFCPDVSGTYCAVGLRWQKGETGLSSAHVMSYLGLARGGPQVNHVTIEGATDGALNLHVFDDADQLLSSATLSAPELQCGAERVLLEMRPQAWGGSGPLLAFGGSGGWNLMSRGADGVLRIEQVRRERGVVLLTLPLAFTDSSYAQFRPVTSGCTSTP